MTRMETLIAQFAFLRPLQQRSEQTQIATLLISERLHDSARESVLFNITVVLQAMFCKCCSEYLRDGEPVWTYDSPAFKSQDNSPLVVCLRCRRRKCTNVVYCGGAQLVSFASLSSQAKWESRLLNALGGLEFATYCFGGLLQEKATSWYGAMKLINSAIVAASKASMSEIRQRLVTEGGARQVAFDGAWATRGHHAFQFSFVVYDLQSGKIVYLNTLFKKKVARRGALTLEMAAGNFDGTSNGMEAQALHDWINEDPDNFLTVVKVLCSDGDLKVPALLEQLLKDGDKIHARDRGHGAKSFGKKVRAVLGDKYKQIYKRMQIFLSYLITRVLKEAKHADLLEEHKMRCALFATYWRFAYSHYTTEECDPGCPCNESKDARLDECEAEILLDADDASVSSSDSDSSDADSNSAEEHESQQEAMEDDDDEEERQHAPLPLRPAHRDIGRTMERDGDQSFEDSAMNTSPAATLPVAPATSTKKLIITLKHECTSKCLSPCRKVVTYTTMHDKLKRVFVDAPEYIKHALWDCNTTFVENSNSVRGKFVKKTKAYGSSYESRSHLSAMIQNLGYLAAAEKVWDHLRNSPTFFDTVGELTHLIRDQLRDLDAKRSRDSARKKSEEYKKAEKAKSREYAAARKLETKQPAKGAYTPGWGLARRGSSTKPKSQCPDCGVEFVKLGVHRRFCQGASSSSRVAAGVSQRARATNSMDISDDEESDHLEDSAMETDEADNGDFANSQDASPLPLANDHDDIEPPFFMQPLMTFEEQMELAKQLSAAEKAERDAAVDEEKALLKTALSKQDLYLHDLPNSRTGACYFFSIAHFYRNSDPALRNPLFLEESSITPDALRACVVAYMRANPNMLYTKEVDGSTWSLPLTEWFTPEEWEKYLLDMAKPSVFAEDMVIAAASNCLNLYQRIHWGDQSETVKHETRNRRQLIEINIGLTLEEKHYYAITADEFLAP